MDAFKLLRTELQVQMESLKEQLKNADKPADIQQKIQTIEEAIAQLDAHTMDPRIEIQQQRDALVAEINSKKLSDEQIKENEQRIKELNDVLLEMGGEFNHDPEIR